MTRETGVIVMGEEVAQYDGAYKVTKGLLDKYGADRVLDTPITELGFTGLAVGAAFAGMRPVVEWMTFQFGLLAIDQLINNAVKYRSMSGGQFKCPLVIRGPNGPAEYLAGQHSQSFASYFVHVPRLQGRGALDPLRRQGPAQGLHPRRQPRHLPGKRDELRPQG